MPYLRFLLLLFVNIIPWRRTQIHFDALPFFFYFFHSHTVRLCQQTPHTHTHTTNIDRNSFFARWHHHICYIVFIISIIVCVCIYKYNGEKMPPPRYNKNSQTFVPKNCFFDLCHVTYIISPLQDKMSAGDTHIRIYRIDIKNPKHIVTKKIERFSFPDVH